MSSPAPLPPPPDATCDTPGCSPAPLDAGSLEQRLAAREAELAALHREFEQFAYGVSHDLRAPLRAIDSFAGLLQRHLGEGLDDTARGYVQRIQGATVRLNGLIDALLELSRAGRRRMERQRVDLSLLADWAAAELIEADPQRAAQVEVQPDLAVEGDETLLRQLLQRLLHNAWKFSAGSERIEIDIRGERIGDRLQLHIRDAGSGFDMRYADKLFQPFERLHGPDQGGGHGMGLAIAQRIVERHGGRIWAESEPGVGSTFHVELPDTPTQEAA